MTGSETVLESAERKTQVKMIVILPVIAPNVTDVETDMETDESTNEIIATTKVMERRIEVIGMMMTVREVRKRTTRAASGDHITTFHHPYAAAVGARVLGNLGVAQRRKFEFLPFRAVGEEKKAESSMSTGKISRCRDTWIARQGIKPST